MLAQSISIRTPVQFDNEVSRRLRNAVERASAGPTVIDDIWDTVPINPETYVDNL